MISSIRSISTAFFPHSDPAISLLLTLGTFALSFLTRPLGGVLLGVYADRHGRKASLMVSILMMTVATLVITFMPSYQTIGLMAPVLVLLARLELVRVLQVVERAGEHRAGRAAHW